MQEESKPSIYEEDTALSAEEAADLAAELKTQLKGQESAIQLPVSKPKKMTNGGFV